jgi:thioredoxin reductase
VKGTQRAGGVSFSFEGREVTARAGVSLAAALAEAGEFGLRETARGERRGLFCGMGVCQECRVVIDGERSVRACLAPVAPGATVTRETSPTSANGVALVSGGEAEVIEPEVLVIGAGPAGMIAAAIAAENGAEVVVLDERPRGGGQYYKQPASQDLVPPTLAADPQFSDGATLIERMQRSGATVVPGAELWGAFAPQEFTVFDGSASRIYRPARTIVATGAHERGLPLPGWTLPGVMTTGAAQSLLRNYGSLPGKRMLVAGNGPFNLQVALELRRAGADIVAVAELAARPGPPLLPATLRMLRNVPGLAFTGLGYLASLRRCGVPVLYGKGLASIEKSDAGLVARVGPPGPSGIDATEALAADVICMGYGFQPNNEILRCLGCRHDWDGKRGHLVTRRSAECETSVTGVFAVGDCCGFSGAASALADGVVAAHGVLRSLERPIDDRHDHEYRQVLRAQRRHRRFQEALWQVFAAPRYQAELATPETTICRCENVSLAEITGALQAGTHSIGALKRHTRLGMGRCQGRYCAPVAADLIAQYSGVPIGEYSFFAPRSPLKPIRICDVLATSQSASRQAPGADIEV